ncbi:ribulose-phosphate 3-epimerase [Spiroplasma tabanidicola]|uniref:Ribulose-phosphate 3-epimerase n=1 Tax=Spiroplasma tabanidicola TaxID=324079 RepID=A0A6I6C756_9MOLU|nr:ribulose-phosphate 3-epimerase [Spiroplasma tabanidicola]QGS51626.1 ribulose-phosphate 3-epimerase [Spiroplasma tabanidicola]
MNKKIVAVSIYVFNFLEIGKKLEQLTNSGVNWIHLDIMDGIFVNNYALCQKFCSDIREKYKDIKIDIHMMCVESYKYIDSFSKAGANYFNFHYESITDKSPQHINEIIQKIKNSGMKPIMALNPETSVNQIEKYLSLLDGIMCMNILPGFNGQKLIPESYEKIKNLKDIREKKSLNYFIMTDGGAREDTYSQICESGADVIVVGAFVNVEENKIKEQVDKIQKFKNK